jgi:predicted GNAT family acetyltransferase
VNAPEVQHLEDRRRFELHAEGRTCELDYALEAGAMIITHTGVPPALEGRGLGAALVRAALALARARGWSVVPTCSFAAVYVRRHPEELPSPALPRGGGVGGEGAY